MNPVIHRTQVRVTYAETDAMGIVYYANYLRWFEVGRTELMRSMGLPTRKWRMGERFSRFPKSSANTMFRPGMTTS
jgi:YbgC/YbaW family acyl-CoA thioester hydrolase